MRRLTLIAIYSTVFIVGSMAAAEDPIQVLYGCAQKNQGILRIVESLDECRESEIPVSFATGQVSRRCPAGASIIGFSSEGKMMCSDGTYGGVAIGSDCPHNLVPFADLRNCDFSGQTFDGDLHGANLENANLYQSDFSGADLSGANLTGVNLREAILIGAMLDQAVFTSSILIGTRLDYASLRGADFANTVLEGVNIREADLSDANLQQARLTNVYGYRVRIVNANLTQSTIRGSSYLNYCEAEAADFSDSTVYGPSSTGYTAPFGYCSMAGSRWNNARLYDAGFYLADLTGAEMLSAIWRIPNYALGWRGTKLIDADLTGSYISSSQRYFYYVPYFSNTTCSDGTNSDDNVPPTCMGHLVP